MQVPPTSFGACRPVGCIPVLTQVISRIPVGVRLVLPQILPAPFGPCARFAMADSSASTPWTLSSSTTSGERCSGGGKAKGAPAIAGRKDLHRSMVEAASSYESSIVEEVVSMSQSDGHGSAIQFEGGSPDGGSPGSAPVQKSRGDENSESYDTEFYPESDEQVADGPARYNIASDSESDHYMTKDDAVLPRPLAMKQRPVKRHGDASSDGRVAAGGRGPYAE